MRRISRIACLLPAVLAGTLAWAPGAAAAASPPMVVTITSASGATGNYFRVSAGPEQVKPVGTINLRNSTDRPVTVMLDPVRGLTASTLGSAYALRGSKRTGAASWVVLGQRRVQLSPRGQARVPVSIRVGAGVRPGDYLAGIGVQAAGRSNVQREGNLAIGETQRYAVGLLLKIPGPRHPKIKLTGVRLSREPAGVTFSILARNTGNVVLQDVQGAATVSSDDEVVARRKMGPGTFVTDTSIAYPLLIPSLRPEEGTAYRVQAILRYEGGTARIDRVVEFGAIDAKRQAEYGGSRVEDEGGIGKLLPILLAAAALAALLGALIIRRRRERIGRREAHPALERAITHSRASGEPLSVILVGDQGEPSAALDAAVHSCLRGRDQLLRPNGTGLMVLAPDTTPEAGEMLAAEIKRRLSREVSGRPMVIPVTGAAEASAEELLEAARAMDGESGRGDRSRQSA